MDSKQGIEKLASCFSRQSTIGDVGSVVSVDPLQPNILYRHPNSVGYHSRCSSAQGYIENSRLDGYLSQASAINEVFPKRGYRGTSAKSSTGYTMTDYGRSSPLPSQGQTIRHHQPLARPSSQQKRLEEENNTQDKIKTMKRLAQVVPHRLDVPYYMSGRSAKLTQKYQINERDLERLRLQQASYKRARELASAKRRINGSAESRSSGSRVPRGSPAGSRELDTVSPPLNSPTDKKGDRASIAEKRSKTVSVQEAKHIPRYRNEGKMKLIASSDEIQTANDPFNFESLDSDLIGESSAALGILSKRQKIAFEAIFNDIDFDSNGKVSFDELVMGLFSNISKKDARKLMQIFDIDKNKHIDRREFVVICALNDRLCGFRTTSKYDCLRLDLQNLTKHLQLYKALFEMLDQDGDEKIHIDEVMLIMTTAMGKEIGMNQMIAQSVMDNLDRDESGYINFINFLTFIPFFLRLHNAMMNNPKLQLDQIEEAKTDIRENLRSQNSS